MGSADEDETTEANTEGAGPVVSPDRSTAPMSEYSTRDVAIGITVLIAGIAATIAIPVLAGL